MQTGSLRCCSIETNWKPADAVIQRWHSLANRSPVTYGPTDMGLTAADIAHYFWGDAREVHALLDQHGIRDQTEATSRLV